MAANPSPESSDTQTTGRVIEGNFRRIPDNQPDNGTKKPEEPKQSAIETSDPAKANANKPNATSGVWQSFKSGYQESRLAQGIRAKANQLYAKDPLPDHSDKLSNLRPASETRHNLRNVKREAKTQQRQDLHSAIQNQIDLERQKAQLASMGNTSLFSFSGRETRKALMAQAGLEVRNEIRAQAQQRHNDYRADMASHSWFNFPGKLMTAIGYQVSKWWNKPTKGSIKRATKQRYRENLDAHNFNRAQLKQGISHAQADIKHAIRTAKHNYQHRVMSSSAHQEHSRNQDIRNQARVETMTALAIKGVRNTAGLAVSAVAAVAGVGAGLVKAVGAAMQGKDDQPKQRVEPTVGTVGAATETKRAPQVEKSSEVKVKGKPHFKLKGPPM